MSAGQEWTLLGLGALIVSNIGIWLREWRLSRRNPNNGKALRKLDEVKASVNVLGGKTETIGNDVGGIKKDMAVLTKAFDGFETMCSETRGRFAQDIAKNEERLLDHITKPHGGDT